jgi:hypothetical protein
MNVVDLDHERDRAARQQANADAFLEMESEIHDAMNMATIATGLLEDHAAGEANRKVLSFSLCHLEQMLKQIVKKYYGPPSEDGNGRDEGLGSAAPKLEKPKTSASVARHKKKRLA